MIKNKKTIRNYHHHKYRQQQAGCLAQVSPLIGRSKYLSFFFFFLYEILLFFLLTINRGATQKNLEEAEEVGTQSVEMDNKIAQSVKLIFETCEAELGVFLALFGHEKKR
jgi:hypothetical protein